MSIFNRESRRQRAEDLRVAQEREALRRARARQAQVAAAMSSVPAPRHPADDAGLPRRSPITV